MTAMRSPVSLCVDRPGRNGDSGDAPLRRERRWCIGSTVRVVWRQSRDAAGPRPTGVVSALGLPRRPDRDNALIAPPAAIAFHSP